MRTSILFLILLMAAPVVGHGQKQPQLTRILIIFDASNSMWGTWGKDTKIESARRVLISTVDSLRGIPNLQLALRMYGHQVPIEPGKQDCSDTKLEIPFGPDNHTAIINKIKTVVPKGTTPIARSLEYAGEDFPDKNSRNIIILITDGIEACDEDPCAVSRALGAKGISVKPFVVGIGLDISHLLGLQCIGTFFDANNEQDFKDVLQLIFAQVMNNTTVQVDLLDTQKKPKESNVTVSFYDQKSGVLKKTMMHTLNYKGNPDTITLEPLFTYRMVVHTIPQVEVRDIKIISGQHNTIPAYCPQGYLNIKMNGFAGKTPVNTVIRQTGGDGKTLHVQYMNTTEKLITGKYDLEVLTLPRLYFNNIDIKQSETTKIEIPRTGYLYYTCPRKIYGAIFQFDKKTDEWVYNLNPNVLEDNLELLPGKYKVVYREADSNKTVHTREVEFTIRSGAKTDLNL
jgi:Ca-activated chloride channel family protein